MIELGKRLNLKNGVKTYYTCGKALGIQPSQCFLLKNPFPYFDVIKMYYLDIQKDLT